MKRILAIGVVALVGVFCLTAPVWADQLEDGLAARERGDFTAALRLLKPLAELGNPSAQLNLGGMYAFGQGVAQDRVEAVKWFHKAADQGLAAAQFSLGYMYLDGQGVPQNYAVAVNWLRKAAEQGDARGQVLLGTCYAEGQGVPQDYVQAHMWFNLAAARLSEQSDRDFVVEMRDRAAAEMTPQQIAKAQALATEWSATGITGPQPERLPQSTHPIVPAEPLGTLPPVAPEETTPYAPQTFTQPQTDQGPVQASKAPILDTSRLDSAIGQAEGFPGSRESGIEGIQIQWRDPSGGRQVVQSAQPEIPAWVSREGLRLQVSVSFVLQPSGYPRDIRIAASSGYSDVDTAVVAALRRWRFISSPGAPDVRGEVTYRIIPR